MAYNFAIIGRNFVVDSMLDAAARLPEVRALGVYSRTEAGAREFADKHGLERTYTELAALGRDPDIDFVYIASPNSLHREQTLAMLDAGKHVLCEKPLATNERDAREMLEAARSRGLVLMEAMMPAHSPALDSIKRLLPRLGKLRRATLSFCQYSSRYDKFKRGIVENAFNPRLGNGALMDIGIYCVHTAIMLFGAPKSVQSSALFLPGSIDGAGSAILEYPEMQLELRYSKIASSALASEIQGEDGCLHIDAISHPGVLTLIPRSGERETHDATPPEPVMYYELADFAAQLHDGRDDCFAEYTLASLALTDSIRARCGIDFR